MQKTVYEDYKYSMQDTGNIYVGCKYTFEELLNAEDILFKFRLIVQHYILPEADAGKKKYVTRLLTVEELAKIPPKEKEKRGYVIQELRVSKLALVTLV